MKARPTTYRGTRMRSRLEAHWAQMFDLSGFDWSYEPENFAGLTGQYLPDFAITTGGGQRIYVEIKPPLARDELVAALARMEIIWESTPGAVLWLIRLGPGDSWSVETGRHRHWTTVGPELMFGPSNPDHISHYLPDLP